jgi:aryl-alcohol dehydrogenase-like predicted oxidoreductase
MVDQVRLGGSGLHVSRLGLGMMSFGDTSRRAWVLDEERAEPIVRRALEAGITFFDTADMYAGGASEVVTGRLLRKLISRDEAVVATKVFYPTTPGPNGGGLSRKHVLAAIDASLRRLGLDHVDLYQVHRWDPGTPVEETMEALHDVVRAGKARYLGASAFAAWQLAKAQHTADRRGWPRFVSQQGLYTVLSREAERETVPCCVDQGLALLPYSPLARGFLTGARSVRAGNDPIRSESYGSPDDVAVIAALGAVAAERGVPPARVALAWLLSRPGVTAPLVGATRPEHVNDAVAAAGLQLSPEELARLDAHYRPRAVMH